MTFLDSQLPLFDPLITAYDTGPMKEFTLDFITARLMHDVFKRKVKVPQGQNATMLSHQPRMFDNNEWCGDAPRCYNCGKLSHIVCICRIKTQGEYEPKLICSYVLTHTLVVRT